MPHPDNAALATGRDEWDGARCACTPEGFESVWPCLDPAEQADRDEVDTVE